MTRRLSRRAFVARALALGGGAVAAALAACRRGDRAPAVDSSTRATGALEPELHLYNWSDYIAPDTVANFQREFGVRVTYDTYESNEEMVARLQAGATGYDIVVPSSYMLPVLDALHLMMPLDHDQLPLLGNLAPIFAHPEWDPDHRWTVPWQWGLSGIAWRSDLVADGVDSWGVFLDQRYARKMTMLDDVREVLGAMLRWRGHSLNTIDPALLDAAKTDAIAAKRQLAAYASAPVKGQLVAGDVAVAQLWSGDARQAQAEEPRIAFDLPKEGGAIFVDCLVIPAGARHPKAAHAFMNYILRAEVGAAISATTRYGTPNAAAAALLNPPIPFPTVDELKRLEYFHDLGANAALWDRLWTEIKSA